MITMRKFVLPFAVVISAIPQIAAAQILPNMLMWFEAQPLNPLSSVESQGVGGQDTVLGCNVLTGPASCSWRITMWMDNSLSGLPLNTLTIGLDYDGNPSQHSIDVNNYTDGNYPLSDSVMNENVNAGNIARYKRVWVSVETIDGVPTYIEQPTGVYAINEFTLTSSLTIGSDVSTGISMETNNLLSTFVAQNGIVPDTMIQFGDAATINGTIEGTVAPDVIKFELTPEPASACMLIGICVALRRRRTNA